MTNCSPNRTLMLVALTSASFVALSCGSALAAAPSAAAQTPANPGAGEVIVTARQRQEELRNVPAQVTAFTAQKIENKGIEMPRDFIQSTPNVTLVETQNVGTAFVVVRGISQARNSSPSVAVVVDGVPQTQPEQFNQELADIQQIEVVKGPQGALYGRNAIGGAILITTKAPGDMWEGKLVAGYDSGPGGKGQAMISGPLTSTLGVRADVFFDHTDGYLENTFLNQKADPWTDVNGRLRFLWKPTEQLTADLRLSADRVWTRAFYYNIVYYPGLDFNPGPPRPDWSKLQTPDVNNVSIPIQVNNPGVNHRAIYDTSLKLDYKTDYGTFTSISGYNLTKELYTGDSFDFLPAADSLLNLFAGFDQNQSLFLRARTLTQEFRFTSPADKKFRWIAGAELYGTNRFISTGNEWDTGNGVQATFYSPTTPAPAFPGFTSSLHPQATFLADEQHNFAWAGYLDTSYSLTEQLELSANVRYDQDQRKNITDTPQSFLNAFAIPSTTGAERMHTFKGWQPQFILKYTPDADLTLYASYSRGFRSGGFNQTGVATAAAAGGFAGVGDIFKAEHDESYEVGFKSRLLDNRLALNASAYLTHSKDGYFFVFLASNSTQNLGNIPEVRYEGFDADATLKITDDISADAGFGYTDSKVTKYYNATFPQYDFRIGEQAPLVSRWTADLGGQYRPRLTDKLHALVRLDWELIGPTYFWESDPDVVNDGATPVFARKTVGLLNARVGVEANDWSLVFWAKNLNNHIYNAEYSPGGFVFKALPRRWGIDLTKKF